MAAYVARNRYLDLFEMAPRTFGETWGQNQLMELVPEFQEPNRVPGPTYSREYALLLDGIKVEVKASRVVEKLQGKPLAEKALLSDTDKNFDMNFQQLKPGCCDVFVWIAVWHDKIDYWMLTSEAVSSHPLFSNQHRASRHTDDGGVVEGQIHINRANYSDFEQNRVPPEKLLQKIRLMREYRED